MAISPFLFAAAFVLDRFAATNTGVHELARPLLVALAAAGLPVLLFLLLTRQLPWAALLASVGFLVVAFHPIQALVMGAITAWWIIIGAARRFSGRPRLMLRVSDLPMRVAVVYAAGSFVLALGMSIAAVIPSLSSRPTLPLTSAASGGPDIYLLMLDGYPRLDTLGEEFGLDTAAFEADLDELGFAIAHEARANYNKTWLTTASLLSAQYVHEIPEIANPPADAPAQARLSEQLINAGPVLDDLRRRGYVIVSIPSPVTTTDVFRDATIRQVSNLNSFEIALLSAWLPAWLAPDPMVSFLAADARGHVLAQLDAVRDEADGASSASPRLVLAHLMSPHPPFIMGQDPSYLRGCFPGCKVWETTVEETGMSEDAYVRRMRTQVSELNGLLIPVLADIVSNDPDAVVIVMSDHGARHFAEETDEHFRILFASRTPGLGRVFPDDVAPVNIFRRLLSASFGQPLPDLPYEAWESNWHLPLVLTRHD